MPGIVWGRWLAAVWLAVAVQWPAHAAPPPIEVYGALPAIDQVSLSPSGSSIAIVSAQDGVRTLKVRDVDGDAAKIDMRLGKVKANGVIWIDDDHLLMFLSKTMYVTYASREKLDADIYVTVNVKTGKANMLASSLAQGFVGVASDHGKAYAYFYSAREIHNWVPGSLVQFDIDAGKIGFVLAGSLHTEQAWLISRASTTILAEEDYDEQSGHWAIYAGLHGRRVFDAQTLLRNDSLEGLGRTAATVLIRDLSKDEPRWLEVGLADGSQTELFKGEVVDGPLHDPKTGLLIGASIDDGARAILFDAQLQSRIDRAMKPADSGATRLVSLAPGSAWVATKTDGSGDSGTWRLTNAATGASRVLGLSFPAIPVDAVGSVRWVDYTAGDGLKMRGVLTLPPGPVRPGLPVVVMPHGGPIDHDRLGFDWWAQAFASRGYAVWQPNFRGSDGQGQAFIDAGAGEWGRKMQTDISDGLAALAKAGVVDPKRACIVGGSYGGYAALAGVTLQHGLYRCAVALAGVSDLSAMLRYEADRYGRVTEITRYWKRLMGASSLSDASLAEISPARQAAQADAPILLIHGEDDTNVPISQSREMEQALKRAGKPVEFVDLGKEDHHLEFEATRQKMLEESIAFVGKFNPPD